jgi:glutamate formiminotransferase/glutamate formiminotransferase/formiminotetrahydrofolate cyclodeaminase
VTLLAIPNVSEGRDPQVIAAIATALTAHSGATLLDTHSDADHNRTVYTLTGTAQQLSDSLLAGARAAVAHIDMRTYAGAHPHVGALDVAPFVHTEPAQRGLAAAAALSTADRLAEELGIPVFLYGSLTAHRVSRAAVRRGGPSSLASRIAANDATPDFGPHALHPRAGATLVAARPPLVAFNVELAAPATHEDARAIAALIREGGAEGLPGVRAIGIALSGGVAQVSTNLEDPDRTRPAAVLAAIARHAPVAAAELVGLPLARHFADFPDDVPVKYRRMLEEALPS